jgi:hypothetical protein
MYNCKLQWKLEGRAMLGWGLQLCMCESWACYFSLCTVHYRKAYIVGLEMGRAKTIYPIRFLLQVTKALESMQKEQKKLGWEQIIPNKSSLVSHQPFGGLTNLVCEWVLFTVHPTPPPWIPGWVGKWWCQAPSQNFNIEGEGKNCTVAGGKSGTCNTRNLRTT